MHDGIDQKDFQGKWIVMFTHGRQIDRRILLQAQSLSRTGALVKIVALPGTASEIASDNDYDGVEIVREQSSSSDVREGLVVSVHAWLKRLVPPGGIVSRYLRYFAWAFLVKPEKIFLNLFERAVKSNPADIYVAHDLPMLPVANKAADIHGGIVVYDSHELFCETNLSWYEKSLWRDVETRHIGRAKQVITVNRSIADELKHRYSLAQVDVIMNAEALPSEIEPIDIRSKYGIRTSSCVALFQGGLTAGRNLHTMIRAFGRLDDLDVTLVVLGDGPLKNSLVRLASKLKLVERKKVVFIDAVPQKELLAYTASADFGLIPYTATCLNNYYCTPNKLFEFVVAGLPIVATDLPEISKLVVDNKIGVVGKTEDAASFSKLIRSALDNNTFSEARKEVYKFRRILNWEQESFKLESIYARIISSKAGVTAK